MAGQDHLLNLPVTPGAAPPDRLRVVTAVMAVLEEAVSVGLAHLSEGVCQRLSTLATSAQGADLARLARELRAVSEQAERLHARQGQGSEEGLLAAAAGTYALCRALAHCGEPGTWPAALVGAHRTAYAEVPVLHLHGVGAWQWRADSGYVGLSLLFWEEGRGAWFTWTDARPVFYGGGFSPAQRFRGEGPWPNAPAPLDLSRAEFKLHDAKANPQHRLSTARGTRVEYLGGCEPARRSFDRYEFHDWQALADYLAATTAVGLLPPDPNADWVVLRPATWGPRWFDQVTQTFCWALLDDQQAMVRLEMRFDDQHEEAIAFLENLPLELVPHRVIGRLLRGGDGLRVYPVSLLNPDDRGFPPILSLTLEAPHRKSRLGKLLAPHAAATPDPNAAAVAQAAAREQQALSRLLRDFAEDVQAAAECGASALTDARRVAFAGHGTRLHDVGLTVLAASAGLLATPPVTAPAVLRAAWLLAMHQAAVGGGVAESPED